MHFETPHRRWNPLRHEWVLNSPQRMNRPWHGRVENASTPSPVPYDPNCYLCPGNVRFGGVQNPPYATIFAFDNDFPALLSSDSGIEQFSTVNGVIRAETQQGICRVLCFSPRHDLTLAQMDLPEIVQVIELWRDEYETLAAHPHISHVMTFENKGEIMGTSNPHPHCQLWATSYIPSIPLQELKAQNQYFAAHSSPLLLDYLRWELEQYERVVSANDAWVAVVPHWASWPFEVMILPRTPVASLLDLSAAQIEAWGSILKDLLGRYDNLFGTPFPYSMGLYQRPTKDERASGFILHQTFFPPLLRSATVRKFMVGFELCAETQRDITPEFAAQRLREAAPNRGSG